MHFHGFFHRSGHRFSRDGFDGESGGGHHRRGGGHHRRGGARIFDHGDLRLVILALLAEKPRYGYDIIKELEERVGGDYSPSPGVIYPTLTLLEEVGHATVSDSHGGRKLYTLTSEGADYVSNAGAVIDAIFARIKDGAIRRGPPPTVARALESLSTAVRLRLKGQVVSDAEVRAIADIIDSAVRAIEEL